MENARYIDIYELQIAFPFTVITFVYLTDIQKTQAEKASKAVSNQCLSQMYD